MRVRWLLPPCLAVLACVFAVAEEPSPGSFDWPQWQGPERTGVSREPGLLPRWERTGPPLAWKAENLGGGFSAPAVASGRVIGMSYRGADEVVWALDEHTGKELWIRTIAPRADRNVGHNQGPRGTPTIDGERVYVLGVSGDLVCLDLRSGKKFWGRNLVKDFGGKVPRWGYSESPLVDGKLVLATPGADTAIVALDKSNGEVVWKARVPGNDGAAYASIMEATLQGRKQYVQFMAGGVVAVAADDGAFLWRWNAPANKVANISTVLVWGDQVFASSAYNTGGGMVSVKKQGDAFKAEEVWFNKTMKNHHGGLLMLDGCLYGADGGNEERGRTPLACLDCKTGATLWRALEAGKGSLVFADGRIYYRNEDGPMLLIEPDRKAYREISRFEPPGRSDEKAWAHPVIANGKLYLRDQGLLLVYDIRKK
jgi:outer membrane protein assembly factor BamB